jgi:hypothetical protein
MKYFIAATGLFSIINLNITAKEIIIKQKLIESFEKTVPATENKLKSKSLKPTIFKNWGTLKSVSVISCDKHATHGKKAVKLTIHKGASGWPLFKLVFDKPQDWSQYNAIAIDIRNPLDDKNYLRGQFVSSDNIKGSFGIDMTAQSQHTAIGYFDRLNNKKVNFKKITAFLFYLQGTSVQRNYYIDNIRLLNLKFVAKPRQAPPANTISFQGCTDNFPLSTGVIRLSPNHLKGKNWQLQTDGNVFSATSNSANYTNSMGSAIYSSQPSELTIKNLKNGKYAVYIAAGNIVKNKSLDFNVICGEKSTRLTPSTKFQADSIIFDTVVKNGTLKIKLLPYKNSCWGLGSLAVYPAAKRAFTECNYISMLEDDLYMGAESETQKKSLQQEKKCHQKNALKPSKKSINRGFVIFTRSIDKPEFYETIPNQHEMITNKTLLQTSITADETSQVAVSIHALKDLGLVQTELSKFKNKKGDYLPAKYLKLGAVKSYYLDQNVFYRKIPYYISPRAQNIVSKGQSQRYWLTVTNNASTPSGIYRGNIIIKAIGKQVIIPVEINFLPVKLKTDPRINYGVFVYQPSAAKLYSERAKWKQALEDMKNHGMTSISPSHIVSFKKKADSFDLSGLPYFNLFMRLYQEAGFTGPVINYACNDVYNMANQWIGATAKVIHINAKDYWLKRPSKKFFYAVAKWNEKLKTYCKEKEYPLVYNILLDEHPSDQTVQKVHQPIKELGSITASTSVGRYGIGWDTNSSIDINIYLPGLRNNWKSLADQLHKNGKQMWFNGPMAGAKNKPYQYRYFPGYWSWVNKADGFTPWNYSRTTLRASSGIESIPNQDWWFSVYKPGRQVNSIAFEMYRTGIYDRRAIYTLEQLVEQYQNSSNKEKRKLASTGKNMLQALNLELNRLKSDADWKKWMITKADEYRKKMLNLIIKLER